MSAEVRYPRQRKRSHKQVEAVEGRCNKVTEDRQSEGDAESPQWQGWVMAGRSIDEQTQGFQRRRKMTHSSSTPKFSMSSHSCHFTLHKTRLTEIDFLPQTSRWSTFPRTWNITSIMGRIIHAHFSHSSFENFLITILI